MTWFPPSVPLSNDNTALRHKYLAWMLQRVSDPNGRQLRNT
jgi:hypothetical protein